MDPLDPWADYLRRRGGVQSNEEFRGRGAGRRDEGVFDVQQLGAAMPFPFGTQSSRDTGCAGARQWLNSHGPPLHPPGTFAGAPMFGGPMQGNPCGWLGLGSPQGRPTAPQPPTFLATGAPLGTMGTSAGPLGGFSGGGGYGAAAGAATSCPTAFASTLPSPPTGSSLPIGPRVEGSSATPNTPVFPSTSPTTAQTRGVENAATAAASLDAQPPGATPSVKVHSAFEVLGMTSPSSSARPVDQAERFIAALTSEKRSIPSWQGSPGSLRTWLKLLAHWESETTVPKAKWGIRLYQSFGESSEPRRIADQVPLTEVLTERGYGLILSALMTKYKPYLDVAAPVSIDRFFYGGEKQKNQTFANFLATKEIARQELESHLQERVPDRIAARILLRQAHLSDYQREMVALKDANQLFTWEQVTGMLRPLDRPELIAQAAIAELGSSAASKHYPVLNLTKDDDDDPPDGEEELEEEEEEEEEGIDDEMITFEDREYDEHEAMYIHAYHSAYSDVRCDLQSRRKERGFVKHLRQSPKGRGKGPRKGHRPSSSVSRSGPSRFNKMIKGSPDDLLSRTRCFNCKELGHYARDCPLKGGGKGGPRSSPSSASGSKQSSFVVCRGNVDQTMRHAFATWSSGTRFMAYQGNQVQPLRTSSAWPMLFATVTVRASEALVDTAAEDAVVGDRAFQALTAELARFNLQPIWVTTSASPQPCAGIGGAAQTVGQADVPTCVAGILGVLRFTVLADTDRFQTPPLLPISYLEAIEAVIDLPRHRLVASDGHETPIERLPSGHRSVVILDFHRTPWCLPQELCKDGHDPFLLDASDAPHFSGVAELHELPAATKGNSSAPDARDASSSALPSRSTASSGTVKTTESTASSGSTTPAGHVASSMTSSGAAKTTESTASSGSTTPLGQGLDLGISPSVSFAVSARGSRVDKAESYALELNQGVQVGYDAIERLVPMIPLGRQSALRDAMRPKSEQAGAVTFGLYAHGPMSGITRATTEMAEVCKAVNVWVRDIVPPDFHWTSVTIGVQTAAETHIDAHNDGSSQNMSVTLGRFTKGELWIQADDMYGSGPKKKVWRSRNGRRVPGYLIDTYRKPFFFSPKKYHATNGWSGFRIAVTAFTARSVAELRDDVRDQLEGLGFRVPSSRSGTRHFALSGDDEEIEHSREAEHDLETVFDSVKHDRRACAAGMFKRMLTRAAVWLSNSHRAVTSRHGQFARQGGKDGGSGGGRPPGGEAHGLEEVPCGLETVDNGADHHASNSEEPTGGGPSGTARAGGSAARGNGQQGQRPPAEEEEHGNGAGHRGAAQEVHRAQGVPDEGARVQSPSRCTEVQRQSSSTLVGVHALRLPVGSSRGDCDLVNLNGGGDSGREGAEAGEHPRSGVSSLSTCTPRTPSTRTSSSESVAAGRPEDDARGTELGQHWSCAFFHGANHQNKGEDDSSRGEGGAAFEDADEGITSRALRAEHRPRGLGRCGDDQPECGRPVRRAVLGAEGLESGPVKETKALASALRSRGWLLKSILVMLSLVELEQGEWLPGTMFGSPRDRLWWHREGNRWEEHPPRSFPRVVCCVFPRDQVRADWLADGHGQRLEMSQAARKNLASAWLTSFLRDEEINSTPRLLQRARALGLDGSLAMDLTLGWEFERPEDKAEALRLLRDYRPGLVALMMIHDSKVSSQRNDFAVRLAHLQLSACRGFLLELPIATEVCTSLTLRELQDSPSVYSVVLDYSHMGVGNGRGDMTIQPAVALTNAPEVFSAMGRRVRQLPPRLPTASKSTPSVQREQASWMNYTLNHNLRTHLWTKHVPMTHAKDRWGWHGDHLFCRQFFPRQHLCLPEECGFEVNHVQFTGQRSTRMDPVGGRTKVIEDEWPLQRSRSVTIPWTGITIFLVRPRILLPEALSSLAGNLAKSAAHDFFLFQSEQHALQAELAVFHSEQHALQAELPVFHSEQHAPQAERAVFPSHRLLEGTRTSAASARPSGDVLSDKFDWDDFLADVENEEARFLSGGTPFARDEAEDAKESTALPSEEEARVARELREIVMDNTVSDAEKRTVVAPDIRREVYRLHRNLGHPEKRTFLRALKQVQLSYMSEAATSIFPSSGPLES